MKYIIVKASNKGEWFNKDVALISISDEFKERLIEVRKFISTSPAHIIHLTEVHQYNFGFIRFYDSFEIDSDSNSFNDDIASVESWFTNSKKEYGTIEIKDIDNLAPITGDVEEYAPKCVIMSGGVYFSANNKYGDEEEMWTEFMYFDTLLNF